MLLVLFIIAVIDSKQKMINHKLLYILLVGSIPSVYINKNINAFSAISAAILIFVILSIVHYVSRNALGFGDVKLCSCIALYLGTEKAFAMLSIALIICGLAALILLCINKSNRYRELPFAPFVAIGTIAALVL
jgi:prepilin signal peptidase PulO-like enzyme (type II secretory pathway)